MSTNSDPVLDSGTLREALGHHPTGVALIASIGQDGQPIGLIVGTFTSVSLAPPLVGFFPMKSSASFDKIRESGAFTVNILAHDQEQVCRSLTRSQLDKFEGVAWSPSGNGAPVIAGAVLTIDCELSAVTDAGDHYLAIGRVQDVQIRRPVAPLLFFQGGYGGFIPGSFVAPSDAIIAESARAVQSVRSGMECLAMAAQCEVTAYAKVGDHAVAVATVKGRTAETATILGSKLPLAPPFGEVFLAGAPQDVVDAWLERAAIGGEEFVRVSTQRLEHLTEHGWTGSQSGQARDTRLFPALQDYGVEGITPARQREVQALVGDAVSDLLPPNAAADAEVRGASLVAPIMNSAGRCELMLRMSQMPVMSGEEVQQWGSRLSTLAQQAET